ncbi:MAG: hypothetical protein QM485_04990 [Flavobacteriaceae bacterium]
MKNQPIKPFWKTHKRTGNLTFVNLDFVKIFLIPIGFKYTDEGYIMKTTEINKSIYSVDSPQELQNYVTKFLDNNREENYENGRYTVLDNDNEPWEKDDVINLWLSKGKALCKMVFENKTLLKKFSIKNIFRDNDNECFLSFKNGIVKISKDDITVLKDVKEIGNKYRLTTQFIDKLPIHDYSGWNGKIEINRQEDGEWESFIKCSTSKKVDPNKTYSNPRYGNEYNFNEDGYKSLMSGIGYLLHGKSLGGSGKMILLQDRYIDGKTRQGGNGKSLISRGLEHIVKLYENEGIKISPSDRFKYQGISLGDRIFFIDELRPKKGNVNGGIQIHDLFTDITGSFKVQKKNKNEITLNGDDVPKLLACSNFIVFDKSDSSSMRRIHVVEFSDLGQHYPSEIQKMWGSNKRLLGSEGHWKQNDWNDFFNFNFRCIQFYLKTKPSLFEEQNQHWKTSIIRGKLDDRYGVDEVSWSLNYLTKTRIKEKHYILKTRSDGTNSNTCFDFELHDVLNNSVSTLMNVTEMKKMLFDICNEYGYEYNPTQKTKGNSPNLRKIQKSYFSNGKSQGQRQVIHITNPNDTI